MVIKYFYKNISQSTLEHNNNREYAVGTNKSI